LPVVDRGLAGASGVVTNGGRCLEIEIKIKIGLDGVIARERFIRQQRRPLKRGRK
jgi:hypothetical protein